MHNWNTIRVNRSHWINSREKELGMHKRCVARWRNDNLCRTMCVSVLLHFNEMFRNGNCSRRFIIAEEELVGWTLDFLLFSLPNTRDSSENKRQSGKFRGGEWIDVGFFPLSRFGSFVLGKERGSYRRERKRIFPLETSHVGVTRYGVAWRRYNSMLVRARLCNRVTGSHTDLISDRRCRGHIGNVSRISTGLAFLGKVFSFIVILRSFFFSVTNW